MDLTYESTLRDVDTEKGVLRYHEVGDGPPLVLLHGSGIGVSGWRNYRGNLAAFAEHYHCYALEFPGFGVSDPVGGHPVLAADDSVIRFMDALGIESAAVVGNSMGGVVGTNVAINHSSRIDKLVAIGGVGTNIFSPGPSEGSRLLQEFADNPTRDGLARWEKVFSMPGIPMNSSPCSPRSYRSRKCSIPVAERRSDSSMTTSSM